MSEDLQVYSVQNRMDQTAGRIAVSLLRGTISIFFTEMLVLPIGFITTVFLARRLGPGDFGLFALASRLVAWLEWTSTLVFSESAVKLIGEATDRRAIGIIILRLYLTMGVCIGVMLWVLAPLVSRLFGEPSMAGYFRLFAVDLPIFCLAAAERNILVGMGRFKERAHMTVGYWICRLIIIVLLVELGLSIRGAIIGTIAASCIQLIVGWFYVRPSLFSKVVFPMERLWRIAVPLFLSALSQRIFRLDLFALKALGGTAAQAGYYSAAQNLSIPATMFSKSLTPPLLSTLSRLIAEGETDKAKDVGLAAIRSVVWLVPFAVTAAGTAREIIILILGETYLSASPIFQLLIFAALGLLVIKVARAILAAAGSPRRTLVFTGPMVPIALIGHLVLIPRLGATGAGIVTTSVALSGAVVSLLSVFKTWGVSPPIKTLLNSAICSGLALVLANIWPASGIMLCLKLLVIAVAIMIVFFILGELTTREVEIVRSLMRLRNIVHDKQANG